MLVNAVTGNTYNYDNSRTLESGEGFQNTIAAKMIQKSSYTVYLKKEDMLYSGGNGTGLSYYLKYAEDSTEENPRILAKGIDENGEEFEQVIDVNHINPRSATIVEMRALEVYSGAPKMNGYSSLPLDATNVGRNERQDFMAAFEKEIQDMNTLGEYGLALEYRKMLDFYESYMASSEGKDSSVVGLSEISDIEQKQEVQELKPTWHWRDGPFGYNADVFRNEGKESEYTVKIHYDDGREAEYITDAENIDASNCNYVDLAVKLYHLHDQGKIEDPNPQLILAHFYMEKRLSNPDSETVVNFRNWYEQQLDLEMHTDRNEKNINRLLKILMYI